MAQLTRSVGMLQVSLALNPAVGGSPDASVAEVLAKLTRTKAGQSYARPREALLLNAKFVADQLQASSTGSAHAPFIARLQHEVSDQHSKCGFCASHTGFPLGMGPFDHIACH